eukprot:scaffold27521_cov30-Tisochrysis_lutea.AAC.7
MSSACEACVMPLLLLLRDLWRPPTRPGQLHALQRSRKRDLARRCATWYMPRPMRTAMRLIEHSHEQISVGMTKSADFIALCTMACSLKSSGDEKLHSTRR